MTQPVRTARPVSAPRRAIRAQAPDKAPLAAARPAIEPRARAPRPGVHPAVGHAVTVASAVGTFFSAILTECFLVQRSVPMSTGLIALAVLATSLFGIAGGQKLRDPGLAWWQAALWGVGVSLLTVTVVPVLFYLAACLAGGALMIGGDGDGGRARENVFR